MHTLIDVDDDTPSEANTGTIQVLSHHLNDDLAYRANAVTNRHPDSRSAAGDRV